jgi:hypothetical protein
MPTTRVERCTDPERSNALVGVLLSTDAVAGPFHDFWTGAYTALDR